MLTVVLWDNFNFFVTPLTVLNTLSHHACKKSFRVIGTLICCKLEKKALKENDHLNFTKSNITVSGFS